MELTARQVSWCRHMLAEHKAKQLESSREAASDKGAIERYWTDIPESMHGAALEFLSRYVSASNYDVVQVTGDPSVAGVLGDYLYNHTSYLNHPVRTNGTYFLKAVAYDTATKRWQWGIVDSNDMVLYRTPYSDKEISTWDGTEDSYVVHQFSDSEELQDEWAIDDNLGALEPAATTPEFIPQRLTMTAAADDVTVNEYGWVVNDDSAVYNVTGDIVATTIVADENVYGTVEDPYVEGKPRSGTFSGAGTRVARSDGKTSIKEGRWVVSQSLIQEPAGYIVIGKKVMAEVVEETRLYYGVFEKDVSALVASLAMLGGYSLVDSNARQSQREGIFNVTVTLVAVTAPGSYLTISERKTQYISEETRQYRYVAQSDVAATIDSITTLGSYSLVESNASETGYNGLWHVRLTLRSMLNAGDDLQIGETGGLFNQTMWVRANVAKADIATQIAAIKENSLARNIRASKPENGFSDIYYSLIVVPSARIERESSYERREGGAGATGWVYYSDHRPKYDSQGNVDWQLFLNRLPTAYNESSSWRLVVVTKTFSYSESDPGVPAYNFSGSTSTGGATKQLGNGIWEGVAVSIAKDWW